MDYDHPTTWIEPCWKEPRLAMPAQS